MDVSRPARSSLSLPLIVLVLLCLIFGAMAVWDTGFQFGRAASLTPVSDFADEQVRQLADLAAQQSMAAAAKWSFLVTALGVLISAVGIVFVVLNLREVRKGTEAAAAAAAAAVAASEQDREFFKQERRALIEIASIKPLTPFTWDVINGNYRIEVHIELRNVGLSPAVNTWVDAKISADMSGQIREKLFSHMDQGASPPNMGLVVFPDGVASYRITLSIDHELIAEVQSFMELIGAEPKDGFLFIPLRLLLSANYRTLGATDGHQTGAQLEFRGAEGITAPAIPIGDSQKIEVPVVLVPDFLLGFVLR